VTSYKSKTAKQRKLRKLYNFSASTQQSGDITAVQSENCLQRPPAVFAKHVTSDVTTE